MAITTAAFATATMSFMQVFEQLTALLLIGVDVAIDPFVTGQAGTLGNLLGTQVHGKQGMVLHDAVVIDTRTLAGARDSRCCLFV